MYIYVYTYTQTGSRVYIFTLFIFGISLCPHVGAVTENTTGLYSQRRLVLLARSWPFYQGDSASTEPSSPQGLQTHPSVFHPHGEGRALPLSWESPPLMKPGGGLVRFAAQSPQSAVEVTLPGRRLARCADTFPTPGSGCAGGEQQGARLGEVLWGSALSASPAWVSEEQTQGPAGLLGWGQPPGSEPPCPLLVSSDTSLHY